MSDDYYDYNSKADASKPPLLGQNMGGWITPLVKYYQWTGNKKALVLANGFADSDSSPMKRERVLERRARVEIPLDEIDW